jgi:(2Fe-2S) ferredoxin
MKDSSEEQESAFEKIQLQQAQRHVFLCVGPDCCSEDEGEETWKYLKKALKKNDVPALRTKAACLRVCCDGPWMLVYPEGVWYPNVTPERCERIVEEHLVGGAPVTEWIARSQPLRPSKDSAEREGRKR